MKTGISPARAIRLAVALTLGLTPTLSCEARADNPIVQTNYTADPAPMAYEGRVYLYTTRDEDVTRVCLPERSGPWQRLLCAHPAAARRFSPPHPTDVPLMIFTDLLRLICGTPTLPVVKSLSRTCPLF